MLKINLLPKSIYEKQRMRNAAIGFGCLAALILFAGLAYNHFVLVPNIADMTKMADDAEAIKKQVLTARANAQAVRDSIKPIQAKLDFINAVLKYNVQYPNFYEEVVKWTYDRVVVDAMDCDGTTLTMGIRAKSLNDVGRYLLNMYRATNLFTEVTISGVPGYGGGAASDAGGAVGLQAGGAGGTALAGIEAIGQSLERRPPEASWITFTVTCKLKTPIVAPAFAAPADAGAVDGAAPGGPGAPGPAAPASSTPPPP